MSAFPFPPPPGDGDDPILDAKTVTALMAALNQAYGWNLPTSFPAGTVWDDLWAFRITVTQPGGKLLYRATSSQTWQMAAGLGATVRVDVVESPDGGSG